MTKSDLRRLKTEKGRRLEYDLRRVQFGRKGAWFAMTMRKPGLTVRGDVEAGSMPDSSGRVGKWMLVLKSMPKVQADDH